MLSEKCQDELKTLSVFSFSKFKAKKKQHFLELNSECNGNLFVFLCFVRNKIIFLLQKN